MKSVWPFGSVSYVTRGMFLVKLWENIKSEQLVCLCFNFSLSMLTKRLPKKIKKKSTLRCIWEVSLVLEDRHNTASLYYNALLLKIIFQILKNLLSLQTNQLEVFKGVPKCKLSMQTLSIEKFFYQYTLLWG